MRVLFSFVGYHDPVGKDDSEGPVVTLVRAVRPDAVVLFPTANVPGLDSTYEQAKLTEYYLVEEKGLLPEQAVHIKPVYVDNPDDWVEIQQRVRPTVMEVWRLWKERTDELYINVTSGTPQMCGSLLLWANAGWFGPAKLMQARHPEKTKERIKSISTVFLEEENILSRCSRYLESGSFAAAAMEMKKLASISTHSTREFRANLLERVYLGYYHWDLFNYREAAKLIASSVFYRYEEKVDLAELIDILRPQVELLNYLKQESANEDVYNLTDLYFNAERRFAAGNYADTLARCWRLYEGIIYFRLLREFGVDPRDAEESPNRRNLEQVKDYLVGPGGRLGRFINRGQAEKILAEVFGDTIMQELERMEIEIERSSSVEKCKLSNALARIGRRRNVSIVAHGMQATDKETASEALQVARALLRLLFPGETLIDSYPFTPKVCRRTLEAIRV